MSDQQVLEKAYEDLVTERDRLRGARAGFTSRLGPLPASAAIVIGLAGSAADKMNVLWLLEAAGLLGVLVVISTLYSGLPPYRLMRAAVQAPPLGRLGSCPSPALRRRTVSAAAQQLDTPRD